MEAVEIFRRGSCVRSVVASGPHVWTLESMFSVTGDSTGETMRYVGDQHF